VEQQIMELLAGNKIEGIFFILFMYLFNKQQVEKVEMKKEYREREDKLIIRLERNDEVLSKAVEKLKVLDVVETKLENIETKVDELHKRA
jgi:hypothetical protein